MSTESHDNLIKSLQEYVRWQDKFEYKGSDEAGIKARYWLSEIKKYATQRRQEIMSKREQLKAARNGRNGRPPKVTT
jgi:hypothetical protein